MTTDIFSVQAKADMKNVQNQFAMENQKITQDLAEAHEAMGMVKAFSFVQKLATVATWEDYCKACGSSARKIDTDLQNLNTFGEEFFETSQRLGLGYREMRKLRQLPEDARAEIVDADYSATTDKEELIEKIEDLTAQHAKEKSVWEEKLKRSHANYEAQSQVLADKNKHIDKLDLKLAEKELKLKSLTPERKGELLREEAGKLGYKLEAQVRSSLRGAFVTLNEHSQECGVDHKRFMSGLLAQIEVAINELYGEYGLERVHYTDYVPKWVAESRDENEEAFEPDEFEFEEV